MKRTAALLVTLAILVLGCQKDNDDTPVVEKPVVEEPTVVEVTSVSLNQTELQMGIGDVATLEATVSPSNATSKAVTWTTDNAEIATVKDGVVTAAGTGNTVITATSGKAKATCKVTVVEGVALTFGSIPYDAPVINGAGGTTTITITAEGDWTLTTNADWLTVSPAEGKKGTTEITVTTSKNGTDKCRNGEITARPGGASQPLVITQRPNIYSRKQVASSRITNSVRLTYAGTQWNRIYTILPVPTTNQYQDISGLDTHSATLHTCPDGVNSYIVSDLNGSDVPATGNNVISETFDIKAYEVTALVQLITDIPPYDQNSPECKMYLGEEEGDYVNPNHPAIVSVANDLWQKANSNIIAYARSCYEWTAKNISYGNMNTGLHTISNLMQTKMGDCGNFSSVFISLLRAKGIPARHLVMISPDESGYHVRAEFYVPAYGWIPVDPTFKNSNPNGDYFGKHTGKYVIMSQGINIACLNPDGDEFKASLMQTYWCWYGYSKFGSANLTHVFSHF